LTQLCYYVNLREGDRIPKWQDPDKIAVPEVTDE